MSSLSSRHRRRRRIFKRRYTIFFRYTHIHICTYMNRIYNMGIWSLNLIFLNYTLNDTLYYYKMSPFVESFGIALIILVDQVKVILFSLSRSFYRYRERAREWYIESGIWPVWLNFYFSKYFLNIFFFCFHLIPDQMGKRISTARSHCKNTTDKRCRFDTKLNRSNEKHLQL